MLHFCFVNELHAQELSKIVNSREALYIEAEIARTDSARIAVNESIPKLPIEEKKSTDQKSPSNDSQVQPKVSAYLYVNPDRERLKLFARRDSLSDRTKVLQRDYAAEILRTAPSQAVLRKMQKAMEANDSEAATQVKDEYTQSLEAAIWKKLHSGFIDSAVSTAEIKSIEKIKNALGLLGYLSSIVNSPKALQIDAERKRLRREDDSLSNIYFGLRDEFNRRLKQGKENNDLSLYDKFSKEKRVEFDSIKRTRDSLSKKLFKLRDEHALEITRTKQSQAVLKKMQEAVKADDAARAQRIKKDYFDALRDAAQEQFRLGQIDLKILHNEIEASNKISNALGTLTFRPVKRVTHIIDVWDR